MGRLSPHIHATAIVSAEADLAADVRIGPFCLVERRVRLGPGCVLRPGAHLVGPLAMGEGNLICATARIGGPPQDLGFVGSDSEIVIGDRNTFRESVTVHGASKPNGVTRIGNGNYFMPGSHLAHDCNVADDCFFGDNALVGGHCSLENGVHLGGNSAVHQFCRLGRLSCLAAASVATQDVPPFVRQERINMVSGLHWEGISKAGLSETESEALRQVFQTVYSQRTTIPIALARIEGECGSLAVVREFVAFLRRSKRGISTGLSRSEIGSDGMP